MCIALDSILSDKQTHDARDRFSPVFEQLLEARDLNSNSSDTPCKQSQDLAHNLNQLVESHRTNLYSLPRHDTYSRHIIGTDDEWIGFICRWEKNIISSIHGHPSFAYYQVLAGQLVMEMFEPVCEVTAKQISTSEMATGDSVFSCTEEGQFDNLIHRIRTEESQVFTLHLYSENPAKGTLYQAV